MRYASCAIGLCVLLAACSENNTNGQSAPWPIDSGYGPPATGGASGAGTGGVAGGAGATPGSIPTGSGGTGATTGGTGIDAGPGIAGAGGGGTEVDAGPGLAGVGGMAGSPVPDAGVVDGSAGSAGFGTAGVGGQAGSGGLDASIPDGPCDVSDPPPEVAAWVEETWASQGPRSIGLSSRWLYDSAMKGNGQINVCVRYGATPPVTTAQRDQIQPAMQRWFNKWFGALGNYDCFPYPSVTVKVTGWAVKPGQESLLQWTDRTIPVYTEVSDGSDFAAGEPKCPDSCAFFHHPDHVFTGCPGGEANHFDYTLWMNDSMPSGAGAEGGDWGVRIPVASVMNSLNTENHGTVLHEMGHGFGFPDYYDWTGSWPEGGSVMIVGTPTLGLTLGDQWLVRRFWKETKALRY